MEQPSAPLTESALPDLLHAAREAPGSDRVELYRDAIARHGVLAVEAMEDWLSDPVLMHFALRVVARAAQIGGAHDEGIRVLKAARENPVLQADAEIELRRLGVQPSKPAKPRAPAWARLNPYDVQALPPSAGLSWPGFRQAEFGDVAGTIWRRRADPASLPPLILAALRQIHPHFSSWPIYHSAEVHFAITDRYRQFDDPDSGWRAAKLVVYAHGPTAEEPDATAEAVAGLYLEKGDGGERFGDVDARWDWPRFITSLTDPATTQPLADAMRHYALSLGDYVGQRFGPDSQIGGIGRMEGDEFVFRAHDGHELFRGFAALRHHLEQLPAHQWHELHIWRSWPPAEAISAGPRFASDSLIPVLQSLARIYIGIVRDAVAEGVRALHRVETRRLAPDGTPEVVTLIQAHQESGHFTLPQGVMDELDIPTDGRVRLMVETLEGAEYYSGELSIRSGSEVYFRVNDDETRGLEQIRPKEWIRVTASKAILEVVTSP